jgi:hypothetical protein
MEQLFTEDAAMVAIVMVLIAAFVLASLDSRK